ncbi:mitogen-activated protein kinase kinase kinase 4 isoform X2 [Cimex lectularius]|uniref:Protein kinase domain-containing protein n=1 Tax=Cimex lectularius TaxID=79782 RepID=A0A8I6SD87_CIMLE|nr:mitogen-activated protein kinase kinase kinase 4 isoform X2 [Cimex lectularius]
MDAQRINGLNSEETESSYSSDDDSFEELLKYYDKHSTTPPRTRILRRVISKEKQNLTHKYRHHKTDFYHGHEKLMHKVTHGGRKYIHAQVNSIGPWEINLQDGRGDPKRRTNKREMQRLRGSERDLKLDIEGEISKAKYPNNEHFSMMKVESSNRFLSLSCKLVKTAIQWRATLPEAGRNRNDFHENFSNLVKSGNSDREKSCKRTISREEHLWQTELKDMIWLELQAWRADKTPTQQDKYLCEARQSIPKLLVDIIDYKFTKKTSPSCATVSVDSGIQTDSENPCEGCFWLFCPTCIQLENCALREVEVLLDRLEHAEALYPSSMAFGNQYPMYKSGEFIGRVKAMCLWYNIMRHHRLKLIILGKQLLSYAKGYSTEESVMNSESPDVEFCSKWDFFNQTQPLQSLSKYFHHINSSDTRTYRRFIVDVLKLKGLRKALQFLEHLYSKVLRKGRIAMEKPPSEEKEKDFPNDYGDEYELRRYGYWSKEFQSLNLPSFRPAFLFISRIPLDVIHEFLRLRLETNLEKPSSLSIRQLIKELKEGLKLAVLNKQRYLQHCNVALQEEDIEVQNKFKDYISSFDESVLSVLKLYLKYMEQWVELTQHERSQKNILEEEWKFIVCTVPHVPGGQSIAGNVFCNIASTLLKSIASCMQESITKLNMHFNEDDNEKCVNTQSRQSVLHVSRKIQSLCVDTRERIFRVLCLAKTLAKHLEFENSNNCDQIEQTLQSLKVSVLDVCIILKETVLLVQEKMLKSYLADAENSVLLSRCREVLHTLYKFTFEYCKEAGKFSTDKSLHVKDLILFAQEWIKFIMQYYERGRGVRPRWANYGLEFLVCIADPKYTNYLSDKDFESFRKNIECCLSHIMGTANNCVSPTSYISRPTSPPPSIHCKQTHLNVGDSPVVPDGEVNRTHRASDSPPLFSRNLCKAERINAAIKKLDDKLDEKLRKAALIGNVIVTAITIHDKYQIRPRVVNFPWQRGTKIGQGRFGKVYTAVNCDTGELMAMKEISLQPNDIRTIKKVALEFSIFEGINHEHLVRYYGAEVHREELLIFMQLCTEGTLESLIAATENGLPEGLIRRYTGQLVSAISTLHKHTIVHRDIKPANVFLTAEGNCLKLGDFGSAVKIKAHTTAPGELRGFVGTQAYMAPEVFMKSNTSGHGRAVDIWSLGCVIIEMACGKRPWSEFDSTYQIMFKVGMGETPEIPASLSDEGHNFVSMCIQQNPKLRATTVQLQQHTFLKVDCDEECCIPFSAPSLLENYLKLGIKR